MQDVKKTEETLLPVSLLCGFLGAGKTTLLKHVLETKHAEEDFKCAVIVNDMAALNIDKSLIDQSSLVQSDKAGIYILQKIQNYANLQIQNGKTLPKLNIGIHSKFGQYYRYDITMYDSFVSYSF